MQKSHFVYCSLSLSILFICLSLQVFAQNIDIAVVNKNGLNPIPFVVIKATFKSSINTSTHFVTLADENGKASIPIPVGANDSLILTFKCLGCNDTVVYIPNPAKKNKTKLIHLSTNAIDLPEVKIKPINANSYFLAAMNKALQQNIPETSDSILYTQLHIENNQQVREIQALLNVHHTKISNRFHKSFMGKICVDSIYRSMVKEWNGYEHGDHLMDLINKNPFRYSNDLPSLPEQSKQFSSRLLSDTANLILIESWMPIKNFPNHKAYVLSQINASDSSFNWIKMIQSKESADLNSDWKLISSTFEIQINKNGIPFSTKLEYTHNVRKKDTSVYAWIVSESFSASIISTSNEKTCTGSPYTGLYRSQYSKFKGAKKVFSNLPPESN